MYFSGKSVTYCKTNVDFKCSVGSFKQCANLVTYASNTSCGLKCLLCCAFFSFFLSFLPLTHNHVSILITRVQIGYGNYMVLEKFRSRHSNPISFIHHWGMQENNVLSMLMFIRKMITVLLKSNCCFDVGSEFKATTQWLHLMQ